MHVKSELVDGAQFAESLAEGGNDDGGRGSHCNLSNRVIPSAARNLALIFLALSASEQTEIPRYTRNDILR
jgi:hypothetical protein